MNFKQQKRIKNTALLVRNILSMSDNMSTINFNYAVDLEKFVLKLKSFKEEPGAEAPGLNSDTQLTDLSLPVSDETPSLETPDFESAETQPDTKTPPPPWAKDLYRKIMMKCHPDRNQNISSDVLEQIYRTESLSIAIEAYKEENFDKLIYAGAIVDIFSDKLSANQQIKILNKSYDSRVQKVSEIQESVSWCWGTNWDTVETRIQLLESICRVHSIEIPSKEDLIILLSEHEMK